MDQCLCGLALEIGIVFKAFAKDVGSKPTKTVNINLIEWMVESNKLLDGTWISLSNRLTRTLM